MALPPFIIVTMFVNSGRIYWNLEDPEKEKEEKISEETPPEEGEKIRKDFVDRKERNARIIAEAFTESQANLKVQVGFYLALCYIIGLPAHEKTECLAKNHFQDFDYKKLFTVKGRDGTTAQWFTAGTERSLGMPPLLFSALTSLFSITFSQMHLYNVKHEYDMDFG